MDKTCSRDEEPSEENGICTIRHNNQRFMFKDYVNVKTRKWDELLVWSSASVPYAFDCFLQRYTFVADLNKKQLPPTLLN